MVRVKTRIGKNSLEQSRYPCEAYWRPGRRLTLVMGALWAGRVYSAGSKTGKYLGLGMLNCCAVGVCPFLRESLYEEVEVSNKAQNGRLGCRYDL